ncbi:predicted protein [Naegleria gruberi]|uniref:Predicted protein n=1 Tax=Naegleria gruberi TaxID=5762 RepID=D2VW48_NAEGR|nr:uncharacterized protein NAEGRDRAFT_73248 [Naegleria gruberi]EFC38954.1 predicted protein [Naegleria gruberi]|eukprot:XP_002671698.1 predicted protein [Naegleria gruberi strain NEG-M]
MGVQQSSSSSGGGVGVGLDHLLHSITINSGQYLAGDDDEKIVGQIQTTRQTRSLFNTRINRVNSSSKPVGSNGKIDKSNATTPPIGMLNSEAMERVRDKLVNASSMWLSIDDSNREQSSLQKRILNGSGTTSILHFRRRAASSPEEREKLIMTLAMYLSHKEEMLTSYMASDWMSSVRIIEKMLIPSEYSQFIELAVQVIDENFELPSEDSESLKKKKNHNRNRSGGILSSVSHHQHRRQAVPKNQNLTPQPSTVETQYVNIKLMIVPQQLKYSTLVEACFPVLESFLIDPMDGIADSFAVSLVVDNWFLYFEPDTNLIIPKKLYCTAKSFVDEQIPTFVRVQHKSNQIQSLLASCVSKWNNSMYFKASKTDDMHTMSMEEHVEPSLEDSFSDRSTASSLNQKYYGNSFDFIEDFFVNYLKFDFINTPTAKYLQSFLQNVQKFGFSELMFNASDDLSSKYGEELRLAKDGKLSFLDSGELDFFMDKLSLAIQENEPIFETIPSDCLENNPFVALNILNGAFNIQYIDEDEYEL